MRQTIGEGWPVVEHVLRGVVAMGDAGPEGIVGRPVVEDLESSAGKSGAPPAGFG